MSARAASARAASPVADPGRAGLPCEVAVVDVGSNSVRLVLYRLDGRAMWTTYNEKVLAGLGRDLPATGRLSPDGVTQALLALRRFQAVLSGGGVDRIFSAATAAVRDASDGAAFVARVEAETGLKLRVLRGEEEARFAALGVLAGEPGARGVVGDLGGSSLELTPLGASGPGDGVTLPLGPFALGAGRKGAPFDAETVRKLVASRLSKVSRRFRCAEFHAVGGAWRNIALLHMHATGWPLEIVHQYAMSAAEARAACRYVVQAPRGALEAAAPLSRRRVETLPYGALVMEGLIEALGIERLTFSAYGLREGLIFDSLSEALRTQDPLVAGCQALGARQGMDERLGPALEAWLQPLWRSLPAVLAPDRARVLLSAACRLGDMGARLHPDHRADLVFDQVLRAPMAGWTHGERAFVAQAVFSRYTSQAYGRAEIDLDRVITAERRRRARALGAAMRLGCDLSGRNPELLARSQLALKDGVLVLRAAQADADLLLGEQTRKRLNGLAEALGAPCKVAVG